MFDTKITNSLTQSVLQTIQKFNCRNVEKSDPILGISLEREGFSAGETEKMANKKHPEVSKTSRCLPLELLSRFELETSSLPRMRSTN